METRVTKFSQISNKIFLLLSVFFIVFIWAEYYLHSINTAFLISIPISLALILSYYPLVKLIKGKKENKQQLIKDKNFLKLQLLLGQEEIINDYLFKLFNFDIKEKVSNNHYLTKENDDVFIYLESEILDQNQFNSFIRKSITKSIFVFCIQSQKVYTPEDISVEVLDLHKIQNKIKDISTKIPTDIKIKKQPKYSVKDILCIILNKDKSRRYFYTAILLIFASLFTPFNIYYIIVSTILLILSIYSRFNTKFN